MVALVIAVLIFIFYKANNGDNKRNYDIMDIDNKKAKELLSDGNAIALDVRTGLEVSKGKIAGSRNINVANPSFKVEVADLDKERTYIVYCRSGNRSRRACKIMSEIGFKDIYNLEGGYSNWN